MANEYVESRQKLKLLAQIGLLMGPFLSMVDSNIVNVALPDIAKALNSNLTDAQWVVSAYMLSMAAGLAISPYLAKRFGTLNVYRVCLLGFALGSTLCALSTSIVVLTIARSIQGVLGAPLIPLAMSMMFGRETKTENKNISPIIGMTLFLAPGLGPTIGGVFLHYFSWPSVFWINVPIGLLGFLSIFSVPKFPEDESNASVRFDPLGLILLSGGLTLAVFGTSRGPIDGWASIQSWPYWTGGAVLLMLYALWASTTKNPAVDLRLMRSSYTALAMALCALTSVVMFSIIVIIPLFMENVQGKTPLITGLTMFPQAILMGMGTVIGGKFSKRYGVKTSVIVGLTFLTIGSVLLLLIQQDTPSWNVAFLLLFRGLGLGLVIQQLLTAILQGLDIRENTDANTLFNISERIGGATGVALVVTYLQTRLQHRLDIAKNAGDNLSAMKPATVSGFHDTFLLLAILSFVGLLVAIVFLRRDMKMAIEQSVSKSFPTK
ncbi:DHA2 family efflux MFS transporter permease subunit [Alicyclobacillus sp. SO9]|uniref:DHA2 family efflux MFS transporter permease subunit n=1 Tax=Alicyclobacillus sp. SO9 TaxID=2665646 RepID=UPI0018E818DB|nr:DHA2 family efflux MFS transporter permease subunit [Alicyclobacillus sp. SO9]QQE77859.1 DHA2 family efflux MFS transporter permease subunit [Alicyclobacillus sp. SO9]